MVIMTTLRQELEVMTYPEIQEMKRVFIQVRDGLCDEMEEKNDKWVYDLQIRKKIETANQNIRIVKQYIANIL